MKISCRVRGDWFQVPCKEGESGLKVEHSGPCSKCCTVHREPKGPVAGGGGAGEVPEAEAALLRPQQGGGRQRHQVWNIVFRHVPFSLKTSQCAHFRKTVGGAILDKDDKIKDVLDDNDFVSIGKDV